VHAGIDQACAPTVPRGAVKAIAAADAIAKPLADSLVVAARQYAAAKADVDAARAAGATPTSQMLTAVSAGLSALTTAISEAQPSIEALVAAVKVINGGK
jgi:hypothetical protein